MSPTYNNIPWMSLADILLEQKPIDVAPLATAIEKKGIYTWDRFGRMIMATKGDGNDSYSQMYALDLLALVYKSYTEATEARDSGDGGEAMFGLDQFIEDYDGPLVRFGWPSDECPNFSEYKPEHSAPRAIVNAGVSSDDFLTRRERTSLDTIIRALACMNKISEDELKQPYKLAKSIVATIESQDDRLSENTIADHLKRIFNKEDMKRNFDKA